MIEPRQQARQFLHRPQQPLRCCCCLFVHHHIILLLLRLQSRARKAAVVVLSRDGAEPFNEVREREQRLLLQLSSSRGGDKRIRVWWQRRRSSWRRTGRRIDKFIPFFFATSILLLSPFRRGAGGGFREIGFRRIQDFRRRPVLLLLLCGWAKNAFARYYYFVPRRRSSSRSQNANTAILVVVTFWNRRPHDAVRMMQHLTALLRTTFLLPDASIVPAARGGVRVALLRIIEELEVRCMAARGAFFKNQASAMPASAVATTRPRTMPAGCPCLAPCL